jgi:hypothetical protein
MNDEILQAEEEAWREGQLKVLLTNIGRLPNNTVGAKNVKSQYLKKLNEFKDLLSREDYNLYVSIVEEAAELDTWGNAVKALIGKAPHHSKRQAGMSPLDSFLREVEAYIQDTNGASDVKRQLLKKLDAFKSQLEDPRDYMTLKNAIEEAASLDTLGNRFKSIFGLGAKHSWKRASLKKAHSLMAEIQREIKSLKRTL